MDTWLRVVVSIIGVAGAVGIAIAVFRASYAKAQVEGLRGDRDDLIKRVEILEESKKELEVERDKLSAESAQLKNVVATLERVVTGREQLDNIVTILGQHTDGITQIASGLAAMHDSIRKLKMAS
jgi:uncharacterized coiled-coil DUF342 family protein